MGSSISSVATDLSYTEEDQVEDYVKLSEAVLSLKVANKDDGKERHDRQKKARYVACLSLNGFLEDPFEARKLHFKKKWKEALFYQKFDIAYQYRQNLRNNKDYTEWKRDWDKLRVTEAIARLSNARRQVLAERTILNRLRNDNEFQSLYQEAKKDARNSRRQAGGYESDEQSV